MKPYISVIMTSSGMHDLVYNTFDIGEDADVLISPVWDPQYRLRYYPARRDSRHNCPTGARRRYVEKHSAGCRHLTTDLNPQTIITIEGGYAELN